MRRRLIAVAAVALVAAAAGGVMLIRSGSGGPARDDGASTFATRSDDAGEVTVQATLSQLDAARATVEVVFDTHTEELDLDVARGASLTVAGVPWPTDGWEGDGPSGHHREGDLSFSVGGPVEGDAVLTISGLSDPVTFRWPVP